jgi:hypothetical protein
MAKKRTFVLRDKNGKEIGVFTGKKPRQAALKAANRSKGTKANPVEIRLRERGSKKVHIFKGWKEAAEAPKNKPTWMPDKICKPNVKKVGVKEIEQKTVKIAHTKAKRAKVMGPRPPHPGPQPDI